LAAFCHFHKADVDAGDETYKHVCKGTLSAMDGWSVRHHTLELTEDVLKLQPADRVAELAAVTRAVTDHAPRAPPGWLDRTAEFRAKMPHPDSHFASLSPTKPSAPQPSKQALNPAPKGPSKAAPTPKHKEGAQPK
jgi:hypothetical protein